MAKRTPLYEAHRQMGARMVDFGGWDMPIHYGSQMEEHHRVRRACGMFDVSHMTVVDVEGSGARDYLGYLLANNVAKLDTVGKALYTTMLNERGGVIDDLIVYWLGDNRYRLVVNCATRDKDLAWLERHSEDFQVAIAERPDLAIIAVQGPEAIGTAKSVVCEEAASAIDTLTAFRAAVVGQWLIARTGYSGEDGLEIILPGEKATELWQRLHDAGVAPAGLGARDTLRLEAGLNLYGNDMDEDVSPLEANLGWTVAWEPEDRQFIGRAALEKQRAGGIRDKLVGLVMTRRGVLRAHQVVRVPESGRAGEVTSGTFSPTLGCAIALARVPVETGDQCEVEVRGKWLPVTVVRPGFVRHGQPVGPVSALDL
jgi:aminomethyltransferase